MDYSRTHTRQLDVLPENLLESDIAIIGLGGVGSPTAYILAKMGFKNLQLCDFDKVDAHNIASQFYSLEDIGKNKAEALAKRIEKELETKVKVLCHKAETYKGARIVISAIDSMDERIKIWQETSYPVDDPPEYLIEARMGLEFARIYAFSPYDSKARSSYEKNLYPSSEAIELPCSARAICYNTFFIGSIIANYVKKIVLGGTPPFETIADLDKMGVAIFKA